MSGDNIEENNLFDDYYKTDNFDDSELQARLYAEIYYDSNIEGELGITNAPRTIRFDSMAIERNIESDNMQHEPRDKPPLASETTGDSQKTPTEQTEFTQVNTLAGKEMNPVAHKKPEDSPVIHGKESKENSSKKSKSSKHAKSKHQSSEKEHNASLNDLAYSKYNVVSKCVKQKRLLAKQTNENKHISDSSDSEESIFEVPVPPKPKPPLIDLQDSDEESDTNTGIDKDDPILKKWEYNSLMKRYSGIRNDELQLTKTSNNHQDTSSKNKSTGKSLYNEDLVNHDKSIQTLTCSQEIMEDIVLNCTTIQRGAKNISEIKELSKNVEIDQRSKSTENTNQNFKGRSPQNKSKGNNENNANLQQETSLMSGRKSQMSMQQNVDKSNINNVHNRHIDQDKTSRMESCNLIIDRKRQCNNEVDSHSKQKRQCIIQQIVIPFQDVIPQDNSNKERRNLLRDDFHKPMPEQMRDYYNSSHGQENFDVGELQRGMSKDPRMWAILDQDLMPCPSSKQHTRFWNVRCTNCHRDGHQRYDCTVSRKAPCCTMCGMKGHIDARCPRKMCLTCGKQQNTFRQTCEFCYVLYCTMCNSIGHELKHCPDLWRRYHQTTNMSNAPQDPGNVMKRSKFLHCCNCTKRGHESSTCKEYRWSQHFVTPAVVTNYTDGPTYVTYASSSSKQDLETGILSTEATGNETLTNIPQSASNIQQAMTEDVESFANLDSLSSNANFCVSSTLQEAACISEMEGNLKSSPMVNKIWPTEKINLRQTTVNEITFVHVICSYGTFRDKNHKDARMILKNLSKYFSKRPTLNSLINHTVIPVFLKTLHKKEIEFEVKIGFDNHQIVMLQLLAMKEYIEYFYDLLSYWLYLPDDEKDYGIDVTLPLNPVRMFNLLKTRMPQLEKMRFTCYTEHIGGANDPRWIYKCIKSSKADLQKCKEPKKRYNRSRTKLWRLQVKLLMIAHTEPKPNRYVHMFRDVMSRFESQQYLMDDRLDIATYLRITLLYNHLFVPHTSHIVYRTLRNITKEENKNNSLQMEEESNIAVYEQDFVYNVYSSSSSTASCIPQNIDPENSSAINNQQNNEMLFEGQNINNTSFKISETIDHNYDEIITIKNSSTQDSQYIALNTEPMAQSQDLERNKDQLPTNIGSIVSANKRNINVILDTPFLSKKERKRIEREKNRKEFMKCGYTNFLAEINAKHTNNTESTYKKALELVKKARAFKLPHIMNAADEMQKRINNQTVNVKHVQMLSKLIVVQQRCQRGVLVDYYCRKLRK